MFHVARTYAALPPPRAWLRRLHLWLGLTLGGLFVLLGVTGSALVFYVEIDAALHPAVTAPAGGPAPGWDSPVWDRAMATAHARWPDRHGKWSLEVTGEPGAIPARYYPAAGHSHHDAREMLWFSADDAQVVRAEPWGGYLMSWLYELHMHLLAGETGRLVVGWSGYAILILLGTGLAAWWPRGSWRKALSFKRHAAPIRRLHDLHKLAGLWSLVLLILLSLTGALLALPVQRDQLLSLIAPVQSRPAPQSVASGGPQIPIARALAAGHAALPDARLAWIDVPGPGSEPFRLRVQVPGDPHRRFPASNIFIDQYSARVLAVQDVRTGNAATSTAAWVRPLHDGSVAGTPTRILAIVMGLVPAFLFATGLIRWRHRAAHRRALHQ